MIRASLMILALGISGSRQCILQDSVVFGSVKDWMKVAALQIALIECIEAMTSSLSSGYPVVAQACKRCIRQFLHREEYACYRYTAYLCAGCGHK